MAIRTQIRAIEGVKDPQVAGALGEMKAIVEEITGRTPRRPQIKKLGAGATLAGVINKVNEIIERLQG